MFGLPKDYMNGNGHHVDWEKTKDSGKGKKDKRKAANARNNTKKPQANKAMFDKARQMLSV